MKNKLAILLSILTILLLSSCKGDNINSERLGDFEIELLFVKDGCEVYRFKDNGRYIYWSKCSGRIEYTYNSNKTTKKITSFN